MQLFSSLDFYVAMVTKLNKKNFPPIYEDFIEIQCCVSRYWGSPLPMILCRFKNVVFWGLDAHWWQLSVIQNVVHGGSVVKWNVYSFVSGFFMNGFKTTSCATRKKIYIFCFETMACKTHRLLLQIKKLVKAECWVIL